MSKKIMVLAGSPRKHGNTNTVVQWFCEGARAAGAEVNVIDAAGLKSKHNGCIACMGCQKSDKYECVVEDDIKPVVARIPQNDVVVFATPIYFFNLSAQIKLVMDRMYSLIKFNPSSGGYSHNLAGLKWGLLATGGGDINSGLGFAEQIIKTMAGFTETEMESLLVPHASMYEETVKENESLRKRAMEFGRKLAS